MLYNMLYNWPREDIFSDSAWAEMLIGWAYSFWRERVARSFIYLERFPSISCVPGRLFLRRRSRFLKLYVSCTFPTKSYYQKVRIDLATILFLGGQVSLSNKVQDESWILGVPPHLCFSLQSIDSYIYIYV